MDHINHKILVVDDQKAWADTIAEKLSEQGYRFVEKQYGIKRFSDLLNNYDLAILDIHMDPFYDGFQLKNYLLHNSKNTRIILTSDYENFGIDLLKKAEGVDGWITKKDIEMETVSFVMLVNKILDQKSNGTCPPCDLELFEKILIDDRNQIGIQSLKKIKIVESLKELKTNLLGSHHLDLNDYSVCVDALAVTLSKKKKDNDAIFEAFKALEEQAKQAPDEKRYGLISNLREDLTDLGLLPESIYESCNRIFIVHGHDEISKLKVVRFIEESKLVPIILSEQPSNGRTIIENFEKNVNVRFAVVLMTRDDRILTDDVSNKSIYRPRQNAILELGYFIGKLGRKKVCVLYKEGVEIPSDIHGILFTLMDDNDGWKLKLAKEMRSAGVPVQVRY